MSVDSMSPEVQEAYRTELIQKALKLKEEMEAFAVRYPHGTNEELTEEPRMEEMDLTERFDRFLRGDMFLRGQVQISIDDSDHDDESKRNDIALVGGLVLNRETVSWSDDGDDNSFVKREFISAGDAMKILEKPLQEKEAEMSGKKAAQHTRLAKKELEMMQALYKSLEELRDSV